MSHFVCEEWENKNIILWIIEFHHTPALSDAMAGGYTWEDCSDCCYHDRLGAPGRTTETSGIPAGEPLPGGWTVPWCSNAQAGYVLPQTHTYVLIYVWVFIDYTVVIIDYNTLSGRYTIDQSKCDLHRHRNGHLCDTPQTRRPFARPDNRLHLPHSGWPLHDGVCPLSLYNNNTTFYLP